MGGVGSGGFSAGIKKGVPDGPFLEFEKNGLTVCIPEDETWYFDGMVIDFSEDLGEMQFSNEKIDDVTNPN
ncbi:MAG: hypothetical protein LRY73_04935 [Bacillus sp. (in: Bacteria)]|nr:hypothetical protein [Bacillus sp. (in: firmicutes)]